MEPARIALYLLQGMLIISALAFAGFWLVRTRRTGVSAWPSWYQLLVGVITDFLDTLGVGSFATTSTFLRVRARPSLGSGIPIADENLPGTLNVGHTLPTIAQALIYTAIIEIDFTTLALLIVASVVGAWFGAGVVSKLPRHKIQIGMGLALLLAAAFIGAKLAKGEETNQALDLSGTRLLIGIAGNFVFGALMTIGVGAYAPIMIMVSLLGMNSKAAFPIMMGSCAFLMPLASVRFINSGRYDTRAAIGLTLGGIPAVLVAAYLVKELSLFYVNLLVILVVIYTSLTMLAAGLHRSRA
jgi:uncharacterized membrane protein YfcA